MQVTPERKARMREALEEALRVVDALGVTTACKECEWFDRGFCQKWQAVVPEDAQPKGCDEFMERIPF